MLEQLQFYFRHSLNDLQVNKRLTFFALLSIAAGVAAIVSLQTLAVMIEDALTNNLQEVNRSDIQLQLSSFGREDDFYKPGLDEGILAEDSVTFFGNTQTEIRFTEAGIDTIQNWLDENFPGQVTFTNRVILTGFVGVFTSSGKGTIITEVETGNQAEQLTPVVIDAQNYPLYGEIRTEDGELLSEAIQSPTDIVISRNVADALEVSVGAVVHLSSAEADFTIRGIVPIESEVKNPATDILAGLFGFYYLDQRALEFFPDTIPFSDTIYLRFEDPSISQDVETSLTERFGSYFTVRRTEDLREDNEVLADNINQLVTIMGLVSLLIGSIGIINTMQVIVRRRTVEVAVLKTVGMQAGQVTLLFLTEAFILGIIGSLAGIVLGWGATFFIKSAAEALFGQELIFRITLTPPINGFVVGVLVTTIFGFLPTLVAGQIRPGIVLRPADNIIPKAGRLRSLGALFFIIVVLALVATTVLGNFGTAFAVVFGAFIAAGMLYLVLSLLIWLIGRFFPSLGIVDLKISLRQMLATRGRNASTLLALVVGVFSLSLITLFADSINKLLTVALETNGKNVIIPVNSLQTLSSLEALLNEQASVSDYDVSYAFNTELISVKDGETGEIKDLDALVKQIQEVRAGADFFFEIDEAEQERFYTTIIESLFNRISALEKEDRISDPVVAGRALAESDFERPVMMINQERWLQDLGIGVGDEVTFKITQTGLFGGGAAEEITFEIVGVKQPPLLNLDFSGSNLIAYYGAFPATISPTNITVGVAVEESEIPALRRELARIPGTFALPTSIFTDLFSSLLGTFTAFPTLVAALGLIVGGVVIANSVALSTLERRREIAVMKSVGLQRERVLSMLLLENGILGFIGGLMGVGFGVLGLTISVASSGGLITDAIPFGTVILLMGLCILVALVAAVTSAWNAASEKPLTVLRYE